MTEDESLVHEMALDRNKRNKAVRDVRHSSAQHHKFSEDQEVNARVNGVKLQHFLNAVLQHHKEFKEYPDSCL